MARNKTKRNSLLTKRSRKGERVIEFARKFGIKLGILLLVIWLGAWIHVAGGFSVLGNWAEAKMVSASGGMGFTVQNVMVKGRVHTDADTIKAIVNIQQGDPLFSMDPAEAQNMLEKLSWVKTAQVQRRLPDTIFIQLEERKPLALWQRQQKISLIDEDGVVLTDRNLSEFKDLVIVTGKKSEVEAFNLIKQLYAEPDITKLVEGAVFVSERRWNLKLKDGKEIKLPEDDIGFALRRLAVMDEEEGLLSRSILSVDLRERDRISVQASPNEIERYKASYSKKDGAI